VVIPRCVQRGQYPDEALEISAPLVTSSTALSTLAFEVLTRMKMRKRAVPNLTSLSTTPTFCSMGFLLEIVDGIVG